MWNRGKFSIKLVKYLRFVIVVSFNRKNANLSQLNKTIG